VTDRSGYNPRSFTQAKDVQKGKSTWKGQGEENVNVETYALQHYERLGYKGYHCEGRIVTTLFGLLFWDIIFAPISGAFETSYQTAPLDIFEDTFYHARECLIETRLDEICEGKARDIIEIVDNNHRERGTWCLGVRWDLFPRDDLLEITEVCVDSERLSRCMTFVQCFSGDALACLCRVLCEDYAQRGSGVPDLFLWNYTEKHCKFVEVKGPGDKLQENQKVRIF
jgi:Fanconi-associated nuclease 1